MYHIPLRRRSSSKAPPDMRSDIHGLGSCAALASAGEAPAGTACLVAGVGSSRLVGVGSLGEDSLGEVRCS
jgi:hypothetical protein